MKRLFPLFLLLACAPAKQPWVAPRPEVLLDVLPRTAEVQLDGKRVGQGPITVTLGAAPATAEISAPGFDPAQALLDPRVHAGARVGVVLRPHGFGEGRKLDIDEPNGLATASAWLLRAGKPAEGAGYAERAVELAPSAAVPRRVLGQCLDRLGQRRRAAAELSEYLQLAPPDAPDRQEIETAVARLRGDINFREQR